MSAQHADHPNEVAPAQPSAPPLEAPAQTPAPKRRKRSTGKRALSWASFRLSGLITGAIIVAAVGIYMLAAPAPKATPEAVAAPVAIPVKPPSMTVVEAIRGPITETIVVTGNLVPREEVLVAAQIDGNAIDEILVEEGDKVEKGQVLARLSRSMIDAGLAQSAAQIARADAAIAQARSSIAEADATKDQTASALARSQALKVSGNATEETLEAREAAARQAAARRQLAGNVLSVAEADRNLAIAQQREWQIREQRSDIKAPTSGIISRRTARIGAIATTAGDPLFRIIEDGAIELEANVPEATLATLKPGMAARIVTAANQAGFSGRVRLVTPEVNETTRLGRVRVAIDPAPGLNIGAFGRANIEVASREGLLVPQSAVLYSEEGATLQVVKDGQVETRSIELGLRTAKQAEVVDGVRLGETVIATAGTFVRDGDRVTPIPTTVK